VGYLPTHTSLNIQSLRIKRESFVFDLAAVKEFEFVFVYAHK
jgi:hypothetical protein